MYTLPTNLPLGEQNFENIRTDGSLYVDKTKYIRLMVTGSKQAFLCARPRRFGKTLLLTTLEAYFLGKKELFRGLDIEADILRDDFKTYPVLDFDMSAVPVRSINLMQEGLMLQVKRNAKKYGLSLSSSDPALAFNELIFDLRDNVGKVAILVDEYDAPMLNCLDAKTKFREEVREIMRSFYVNIKHGQAKRCTRFIFVTGISKFSHAGVFSELNIVTDTSYDPRLGVMYGYDEEEITRYFSSYITKIAEAKSIPEDSLRLRIKDYYDGYSFNGIDNVYNPVSILSFMQYGEFSNYWVTTGSQQYIERFVSLNNAPLEKFDNIPIPEELAISPGEISRQLAPHYFLYQAGYLTLRRDEELPSEYYLTYPNHEIRAAMLSLIVNNYFTSFEEISALRKGFKLALHNASYIDAILEINNFLKRIPYDDHVVAERKGLGQWFFRPPILGLLYGAGMLVMAEVHTNKGRSDIVFQYEKHSYVIELKVADGPEKAKKELAIAMEQIRKGKYTGIFANPIPMGLVIDANERLITHVCIKTDVYLINDEKGEVRPMGTLSDLKSAIG